MQPIVIRPSGIWDTRRPLAVFGERHAAIKRAYSVTALSLFKARREAPGHYDDVVPRNYFVFKNRPIGALARRAWSTYRRATRLDLDPEFSRPTFRHLERHTRAAQRAVTEHAIIAYTSAFETYIQCWSLNYLLA